MCIRFCLYVDVCLGRDARGALWRNRGFLLGTAFRIRSGAAKLHPHRALLFGACYFCAKKQKQTESRKRVTLE